VTKATAAKISVDIYISDEQRYQAKALYDDRYDRRAERMEAAPSPGYWEQFRKAEECLAFLRGYPDMDWGDWDQEEPSLSPPRCNVFYTYLETVDEWLERCRALDKEDA